MLRLFIILVLCTSLLGCYIEGNKGCTGKCCPCPPKKPADGPNTPYLPK